MKRIASEITETISTFGEGMQGITTGFPSLDACTRGFLPSTVFVVGARSGVGKSTCMLDMALAASRMAPVSIFSIEMPFSLVQTRALANITQLNHQAMVLDKLMPMEKLEVQNAAKTLEKLPITVDDLPLMLYPIDYEAKYKRAIPGSSFNVKLQQAAKDGSKIIFIDYLQLVRVAGKFDSEVQRLHEVTWYLHEQAKALNVCIVLLSQLRRFDQDRYKEGNPRPRLDDLFGSSTTENDVDVVVLLHRPSYYEQKVKIDLFENKVEEDAEFIIAKSRNGTTGVLSVDFKGFCMSYSDKEQYLGF
jgi:replicative DNA helicase